MFLLDEAGSESFEHKINELHAEKIVMSGGILCYHSMCRLFCKYWWSYCYGARQTRSQSVASSGLYLLSQNPSGWKGPQEVSCSTCCSKAGSPMKSEQVTQSFIQSGLENIQEWRLHILSGQPVVLLTISWSNSLLFK